MKQSNIVLDKFFSFAVRIVKVYKYLCIEKREYVLSKQLLSSGTSIGANINEAQAGESKNDFIAKMSNSKFKIKHSKLIKKYALKESNQPIRVATYKLTESLPNDLKRLLPTLAEISQRLENLLEDRRG